MKKFQIAFIAIAITAIGSIVFSCKKDDPFVNTPPSIEDQQFSINENSPNGTVVDTVVASDIDNGQVLIFSIISGNFDDAFVIDSLTGIITVNNKNALDYETRPVFEIGVKVRDNYKNSLSSSAMVTINLINVYEVPQYGLLAYYPFSGNTNDSTENNLDGTCYATLSSDRFGNANSAYHFNETNQYIDLPNNSLLRPQFPFSISMWFKLEEFNVNNVLLSTDYSLTLNAGAWIQVSSDGYIILHYGDGGGISSSTRKSMIGTTQQVQLNQWTHVVGVYKSSTEMEIYVDGVKDVGVYSGGATSLGYVDNGGSIGRKADLYFLGSIDDVAIYNKVLSQSEVTALYNSN